MDIIEIMGSTATPFLQYYDRKLTEIPSIVKDDHVLSYPKWFMQHCTLANRLYSRMIQTKVDLVLLTDEMFNEDIKHLFVHEHKDYFMVKGKVVILPICFTVDDFIRECGAGRLTWNKNYEIEL